MLTSPKFALSLVFVLATASAAIAAPKQPVRPTAIQQQVAAGAHLSLDSTSSTGSVRSTGSANQPSNISPRGFERLGHLIQAFDDIGFKEDLGN